MQDTFYLRWFYQVLLDFGSVSLPGVGTYTLNRKNAAFIINRTQLQPPSTYLTFLPEYETAKDFRSILIKSGLQPDVSATAALTIADALHPSYGIGLDAQLIKSWPKEFNRYAGLPIITIKPTIFAGLSTDIKATNPPAVRANLTFNMNYIWLLALITAFLIGAFTYLRIADKSTFVVPTEAESIADTTIIYTEDTMVIIDQTSNDTSSNKTDATAIQTDVVAPETIKKVKDDQTTTKSTASTKTGKCIVIVGAFGNTANADKMISKLQNLGYKTYSSNGQGLTRVGLYFECGINDQEQFKSKIRKQIAYDAWFLHDTMVNN